MNTTESINLNPNLIDLIGFKPDFFMLIAITLSCIFYFRLYFVKKFEIWKVIMFSIGIIIWFLTTQSKTSAFTGQSMALYMSRLMLLAEVIPPLLIISLPSDLHIGKTSFLANTLKYYLSILLDPWVSLALWSAVVIFWNIPSGFNASILSNSASQLLPALYLFSSLLVWSVIIRPFPSLQVASVGSRGWFGLLAGLPMMSVAAVWIYSPSVLYTPYANALCLWNLTPLDNQRIAGLIMMAAGLPSMALAFIQLLQWLLQLADSGVRQSHSLK